VAARAVEPRAFVVQRDAIGVGEEDVVAVRPRGHQVGIGDVDPHREVIDGAGDLRLVDRDRLAARRRRAAAAVASGRVGRIDRGRVGRVGRAGGVRREVARACEDKDEDGGGPHPLQDIATSPASGSSRSQ
jgi:hypothetical protein